MLLLHADAAHCDPQGNESKLEIVFPYTNISFFTVFILISKGGIGQPYSFFASLSFSPALWHCVWRGWSSPLCLCNTRMLSGAFRLTQHHRKWLNPMSSYTPPPSQPRLHSLVCFLCCALLIFHILFKPLCHPTCTHISSLTLYISLSLCPLDLMQAHRVPLLWVDGWMDGWICGWLWRQRAQMCPSGYLRNQ